MIVFHFPLRTGQLNLVANGLVTRPSPWRRLADAVNLLQPVTTDRLRVVVEGHAKRALCAERSTRLPYSAIVALSIAVDRATGYILSRLPVALAVRSGRPDQTE
jgi:hypothetical protein